ILFIKNVNKKHCLKKNIQNRLTRRYKKRIWVFLLVLCPGFLWLRFGLGFYAFASGCVCVCVVLCVFYRFYVFYGRFYVFYGFLYVFYECLNPRFMSVLYSAFFLSIYLNIFLSFFLFYFYFFIKIKIKKKKK